MSQRGNIVTGHVSRSARISVVVGLLVAALAIFVAPAQAATGPIYDVKTGWGPTNLPPGGEGEFYLQVRNVGDEVVESPLTVTDELPPGVKITKIDWPELDIEDEGLTPNCTGVGTGQLTCELPAEKVMQLAKPVSVNITFGGGLSPNGYLPLIFVDVEVDPSAVGTATNTATVSGGGAANSASATNEVTFSPTPSPFGVVPGTFEAEAFTAAYPFGEPSRQAGAHPFEQRVNFDFTEESGINETLTEESLHKRYTLPNGLVKDVEVTLPRGFLGNPEAMPKCDPVDFGVLPFFAFASTACPADTQVGYINVWIGSGIGNHGLGAFSAQRNQGIFSRLPIYNLVPPKGQIVDFGFSAGGLVLAHVFAQLDPAQNYAIKSTVPDITSFLSVRAAQSTLWGVPADPAHDTLRYYPEFNGFTPEGTITFAGAPWGSAPIRPFFTNPMDCGFDNGGARITVDSYSDPGNFTPSQEYGVPDNVEGCDDARFRFEPDVSLQPTDRHAGSPTGLAVHLEVPQRNDEVSNATDLYSNEKVKAIATPPIKKAVVTLPQGMTISPSAAQGLESCSPAQIGLGTNQPVQCPAGSQFGTLTLHTPLLPENAPPEGFIYIAKQNDNPFHNFLSLYLVVEEPERGILVKIPGRVDLDPQTGQIKTTFDDLPQFPVSDLQLNLKGGVRSGLVNPSTCGTKTISAEFFTWQDPSTPHPVESSYAITQKPDGSPCPASLGQRQFKPTLDAGTVNNTGGSYSPFVMRLTRTDDDQEFSQLGVTLPSGLAAKFAGVSMCSDAGIARAISRTGAGDGAVEKGDPSCPASSLIGTSQVGTGVGVPLTYVPGNVYLAGPYHGAPLSAVVISPVVVGPFDLGVIAVRSALRVDPVTAQGSVATDPFPQIFQGIPVRIRDIRVNLDRPAFTLNPTSCAEKQIDARITGTGGDVSSTADDTVASLRNRFQAADCASLGFKPRLSFRLFGGAHRGAHPRLRAVYRGRSGDANLAGARIALPHSEFLDQGHIKTVCTRVQFAAKHCPPGSVYGHVVARTPLFEEPLSGPIYMRSSSHPLPDLVFALKGPPSQPVEVDLVGRVDSINGGIRNTFEFVPDAPVSWAVFSFQGGKKGLLINSTDLCTGSHRATAELKAQNGKQTTLHPAMRSSSCGKARGRQDGR